jgi:hypothetical protein
LIEHIAADELLTLRQRREICSALRKLARSIGRRLEEIPASPYQLRARLAQLTPAMAGVTQGRWNNVVSLSRKALNHVGLATLAGRSTEPMAPEWRDLFRHLNHRRMREGLSRFAHYFAARFLLVLRISMTPFRRRLLEDLENHGLIRKPRQAHRTMGIVWNRAAETIADWPPATSTWTI